MMTVAGRGFYTADELACMAFDYCDCCGAERTGLGAVSLKPECSVKSRCQRFVAAGRISSRFSHRRVAYDRRHRGHRAETSAEPQRCTTSGDGVVGTATGEYRHSQRPGSRQGDAWPEHGGTRKVGSGLLATRRRLFRHIARRAPDRERLPLRNTSRRRRSRCSHIRRARRMSCSTAAFSPARSSTMITRTSNHPGGSSKPRIYLARLAS